MSDAASLRPHVGPLWSETPREQPAQRASARATVVVALLTGLALVAVRAPTTLKVLATQFPAEMSAEINDPRLEGLAMKAGLMAGVVVTVFALLVFLGLAATLERHLFSASRRFGPLRTGLFTLTVSVCFIGFQVVSMVVPAQQPGPQATMMALKAVTGLLLPLVFARDLVALPRSRAAVIVTTSVLLAVLTSVG